MYSYFVTGTVKGDGSLSNGKYSVSNNVNNTQYVLLAQCKKISIQSCPRSTKARNGPLSANAECHLLQKRTVVHFLQEHTMLNSWQNTRIAYSKAKA
jgi:hypothetical protein